jgi:ubiquinone/menaquinone biosynthesis C-methylase UbiE
MDDRIDAHYGRTGLPESIRAALRKAGKNLDRLTIDDLAPLEEFHIGGRPPTLALAKAAGIGPESRVIDLGCGVGGPARALAHWYHCRVTGLDLTRSFCEVARVLTRLTRLDTRVEIVRGNALAAPFRGASFDVAWMQHVSMNVEDKRGLFAEARRLLRPGGTLAFYEIMAGAEPVAHYPVPWARSTALSFLRPAREIEALLESLDYAKVEWNDRTESATEWFRGVLKRVSEQGPPPLSLVDLVGPDFPLMARNVLRNLEENRLVVVEAALARR